MQTQQHAIDQEGCADEQLAVKSGYTRLTAQSSTMPGYASQHTWLFLHTQLYCTKDTRGAIYDTRC